MKNHGKMEIFCSFFSNFLVYNKYLRNLYTTVKTI